MERRDFLLSSEEYDLFRTGMKLVSTHRWTASFAYNLFQSIDWLEVARACGGRLR